jgi:hypothetical protein
MKQRHGFVSNSSSSAFILVLPKLPGSVKETEELLFGDQLYIDYPYNDNHPNSEAIKFSTKEIAAIVFRNLQGEQIKDHSRECGKITSFEMLAEILKNGVVGDEPENEPVLGKIKEPEYDTEEVADGTEEEREAFWKNVDEKDTAFAKEISNKLLKKWPLEHMYKVEYADEEGATMEHGEIFNKIPHIRISKH